MRFLLKRSVISALLVILVIPEVMSSEFYPRTEKVIFNHGKTETGASIAGYGGSNFKHDSAQSALLLSSDKNKAAGSIRFANHQPLIYHKYPKQKLFFKIVLTSEREYSGTIRVIWQLMQKKSPPANNLTTKLPRGIQSTIFVPIETLPVEENLIGIVIELDGGQYQISAVDIVTLHSFSIQLPDDEMLRSAPDIFLNGHVADEIQSLNVSVVADSDPKTTLVNETINVKDGRYSINLKKSALKHGKHHTVVITADNSDSLFTGFFCYPVLNDKKLPKLYVRKGKLMCAGKPFGFVGTNFTKFQLGLSIRKDYQMIVEAIDEMAEWGVRAVRIPINIGLIQVKKGVFPDSPQWKEVILQHRLEPGYLKQLDYFIAYAGQKGIYSIIDWHGFPTDPYRYFLGGKTQDKKTGLPGTAISWLNSNKMERMQIDLSQKDQFDALVSTHYWMAKYLKGNDNVLGFEVPYNEPHDTMMSVQRNWQRVTVACVRAIKSADPERLTWSMSSNWGHDNSSWTATWMHPDEVDGSAPHFYLSNGPVPIRPDAVGKKKSWLCRDIKATFSYSLAAVMLPFSSVSFPLYNGEGGEHGWESLLPEVQKQDAWEAMLDASYTQYYAGGMCGSLNWTMWNFQHHFPKDIYARQIKRFSEVYNAGPIDLRKSDVAFVQNVAAIPISNGYNNSCVPLARLMLDLHLRPVHYLTDDNIIFSNMIQASSGMEQVAQATAALNDYKAIVVDRRNLDSRVITILKKLDKPILWVDDLKMISADTIEKFLKNNNVYTDTKTPAEYQLIYGPKHLIVYHRYGQNSPAIIFPSMNETGEFSLIAESGKIVFRGNAKTLHQNGLTVSIPQWRSKIFKILSH